MTERNFDKSKFKVTTNGGTQSNWSHESHGGNGDNDTWTMTIKYSTDGDYKLEVSGSDLAGNRATSITYNGEAPRDFTIDKTDPVIEITFDIKTGYKKSLYFNKTRTATVRIKEHNFDHKDAEVDCPGTIKRGEPGKAKVGSWSGSGDQHDLKITFDKDADYVVKAAYTDLAGNEAKSVSSEPFTIDKTKPVIDYDKKKVENGEAYSGKIEPGIIFSDTNYTREGVTFSMESVKGDEGKKLKKGKIIDDADGFGGRVSYDNFDEIPENDDIYKAKGMIIDKAGNKNAVSFSFSVNRFGSTWDYNEDADTEELVGAYTNKEKEVFLREINVNAVEAQYVDLIHDTDFISLKKGEDYEVKEKGDGKSWKEYVYKFSADNFKREGKYTIVVHSKDKSGNENSNTSVREPKGTKEVPLTFTVDKTNPYAELVDVDREVKHYNAESLPVKSLVHDNLSGVRKVEVFIYPDRSGKDDVRRKDRQAAGE